MKHKSRIALTYHDFAAELKAQLGQKAVWLSLKNLVDYFIPFLPMGLAEVRQACLRELQAFNCSQTQNGVFSGLRWTDGFLDHLAQAAESDRDTEGLSSVPTRLRIEVFYRVELYLQVATTLIPALACIKDGVNGVRNKDLKR